MPPASAHRSGRRSGWPPSAQHPSRSIALWRFLKDPDISLTNNTAERSLRTVVMARKVSQRSKNAVGAQTYMRIKSTVETARLRGQDPVAGLTGLMR
ncbi:IS66 family transposase [Deinococcus knuensis]|uniref:IS66 family transposase n=1 Tax=Deinococcus knuensis TaxID=1837380 RepID=UPI00227D7A14|nr:transposase [Deinococcus knuensis]